MPSHDAPYRRHRPGHTCRMPDLGAFLAANSGADPLSGNYVLIREEECILGFQTIGNRLEMLSCTAVGKDGASTLVETGRMTIGSDTAGKHVGLITADLDGDGLDEIVTVFNDSGNLTVVVARNADPASSSSSLSIAATKAEIGKFGTGRVSVSAGHVAEDGTSGFTVVWADPDGRLNVQLWSAGPDLDPQLVAHCTGDAVMSGRIDSAVGDFDGDGRDELAVLHQAAQGGALTLTVYGIDDSGSLSSMATEAIGPLGPAGQLAISAGSHDGRRVADQMAVAWSTADGLGSVVLYTYDGRRTLKASGNAYVASTYPLASSSLVRVTSGDLNLDGVDEVVLATVADSDGQSAILVLHVLQAATGDVLELKATSVGRIHGASPNQAFAAVDVALAIGEIGDEQLLGLVVATIGTEGFSSLQGKAWVNLGVVPVSPQLALPSDMTSGIAPLPNVLTLPNEAFDQHLDIQLTLELGDFSGKSLRVGTPKYHSIDRVNSIIAILNVPPWENGVNGQGTLLTFHDAQGNDTSLGVSITRNWSHSKELGAHLGIAGLLKLNGSLTRTYGKGFSKTRDSENRFDQQMVLTINVADEVILSGTHFDLWEYPVYNSANGGPVGHLLVLFPDVLDPTTMTFSAALPGLPYFPDHQPGILVSYSPEDPADYTEDNAVSTRNEIGVGPNQEELDISWEQDTTKVEEKNSSVTQAYTAGGGFSKKFNFFGGIDIGIDASLSGDYSASKSSTYEVTYSKSTAISFLFNAIDDPSQEYIVTPFVYFSDEGGFLVVDYAVDVGDSGYWATQYADPRPSFNKLWQDSTDKSMQDYTRSITFDRQKDGTLRITARVANYSFAPAESVVVTFHEGDPLKGGSVIGTPTTVPVIQPRARVNVNATWKPPSTDDAVQIWVTLEPGNGGAFAKSAGFGWWPPQPLTQRAETGGTDGSGGYRR